MSTESLTERYEKINEIRMAILKFIQEQQGIVDADVVLTAMITVTVQLAMTLSNVKDPKAALLHSVEIIASHYEQQVLPTTFQ